MSSQVDKSVVTTSVTLLSALVLLAAVLFLVAALIGVVNSVAPDDGSRKQTAVLDRIQPVARVSTALPKPAGEVKMTGQEVYNKVCTACHAAGVLGAPKVGDKALWEPRFAQGLDTLVTHAVTGIRAMPAKGGDPSLTETHIKDSIIYMLGETGIKVDAAPAPTAEATSAEATPAPAEAAPAEAAPVPVEAAAPEQMAPAPEAAPAAPQ